MKNWTLITALLSHLTLCVQTYASVPTERVIRCELLDSASNRVLARKETAIAFDSKDPVLFLFSRGPLLGTVRDLPGLEPKHRELELSLSFRSGTETSEVHALARYELNQPDSRAPLAEVRHISSSPGITLGQMTDLRCFLMGGSTETLLPRSAMSSISYEYGSGSSWGICSGTDYWFCSDRLKREAREDAIQQARFRCEIRQGRADTWSAHCNESCFPISISPDSPPQNIRCSADCNVRCETP